MVFLGYVIVSIIRKWIQGGSLPLLVLLLLMILVVFYRIILAGLYKRVAFQVGFLFIPLVTISLFNPIQYLVIGLVQAIAPLSSLVLPVKNIIEKKRIYYLFLFLGIAVGLVQFFGEANDFINQNLSSDVVNYTGEYIRTSLFFTYIQDAGTLIIFLAVLNTLLLEGKGQILCNIIVLSLAVMSGSRLVLGCVLFLFVGLSRKNIFLVISMSLLIGPELFSFIEPYLGRISTIGIEQSSKRAGSFLFKIDTTSPEVFGRGMGTASLYSHAVGVPALKYLEYENSVLLYEFGLYGILIIKTSLVVLWFRVRSNLMVKRREWTFFMLLVVIGLVKVYGTILGGILFWLTVAIFMKISDENISSEL